MEIDFSEWVNMRGPWRGRRTGDGSGGLTPGGGAGVSGCLRTISHFTYEMVKTQGKIAMEGDLTPSAYHMLYSIPLVKSDGKLQPKNPVLTAPGFPYALPFRTMDFPASAPIIISITI